MNKKRKANPNVRLPDGLQLGSSITRQAPEWVWINYLPLDALSSIEGAKGDGKGTFIMYLIAHLTTGRALPNDTAKPASACLLYSAEDHPRMTVKPKLDAAKANAGLWAVRSVENLYRITEDTSPLLIDIDKMEQLTGKKVSLVAIDPLNALLQASIYGPQAFRRTANALTTVAEKAKVCLLCTRHHTKSGTNLLTKALGGVEVSNVQRSINAVLHAPDDSGERLWVPVMCNPVPPQPLLRFAMVNTPVRIGKDTTYQPVLTYLGVSATTLADLQAQGRSTPKRDLAKRIIGNMCADGARLSDDVLKQCAAAGVNEKTTRQAVHEMGLIHDAHGGNGAKKALHYWSLPTPKPIEEDA